MTLYKFFEQEYIGKKKHLWTFLKVERIKSGKRIYYVVLCLCSCGYIGQYSPDYCLSYQFPYACKKCRILSLPKETYKLDDEMRVFELQEDHEDNQNVVSNYQQFYKEYYRD